MNIHELNQRRAVTALHLQNLGMMNVSTDPVERLKQDARYRLAIDAHTRAEKEYTEALAKLSTDELLSLAT